MEKVQDRTINGSFQQLSLNISDMSFVLHLTFVDRHASLPAPPLKQLKSDRRLTEVTYVAKASHLVKRLSKPVTMTGTKPALQGYSVNIKEWAERKYRHVSPSLSLSFFFSVDPSILPSTNYARPFTPGFVSMILMQCVLALLKRERESSALRGVELLWKCTLIFMQCSRVLIDEGMGEHA